MPGHPPLEFLRQPDRTVEIPPLGTVCRLGLATRGNTSLGADDVALAVERGVTWLNWCGHPDGMRDYIRGLGGDRGRVQVAVQFEARSADDARRELDETLEALGTEYVDALTYYYLEHETEWQEILGPGGAAEVVEAARAEGRVRLIGATSHQRPLAAAMAESGRLDLLMIRYNAAHRGAEGDVFPVTERLGLPVVAFTCTRWSALPRPTPDDPAGFAPPSFAECYRFVLCQPAVSVALMAPNGRAELEENLQLLDVWRGFELERYTELLDHGQRVRTHAGGFP